MTKTLESLDNKRRRSIKHGLKKGKFMGFFIADLLFYLATLVCFIATLFVYFQLVKAVKKHRDVPMWMYKMGHAFKARGPDYYESITDSVALFEVYVFLVAFLLANVFVVAIMYQKNHSLPASIYLCFKYEFVIVVAMRLLGTLSKLVLVLLSRKINWFKKTENQLWSSHFYASSNAVLGMIFMTFFFLLLTVNLTGVPAKPLEVTVAKSRIVIGSTKASELLKDGFQFTKKTRDKEIKKEADSEIRNKRNDHFYYGELMELVRDGKSYGTVSVTPKSKDTDKLKDCVITYYSIHAENNQIKEVQIENKAISTLTYDDFKNKKLKDLFSLDPADHKETKRPSDFRLELQTCDYSLWPRYTLIAKFNDDKPFKYEVRAQHTIWE